MRMTEQPRTSEPAIAAEAPVVSAHEIVIDAPTERVWDVPIAIDRWPAWNTDVRSMKGA